MRPVRVCAYSKCHAVSSFHCLDTSCILSVFLGQEVRNVRQTMIHKSTFVLVVYTAGCVLLQLSAKFNHFILHDCSIHINSLSVKSNGLLDVVPLIEAEQPTSTVSEVCLAYHKFLPKSSCLDRYHISCNR